MTTHLTQKCQKSSTHGPIESIPFSSFLFNYSLPCLFAPGTWSSNLPDILLPHMSLLALVLTVLFSYETVTSDINIASHFHLLLVFVWKSPSQWGPPWLSYFKLQFLPTLALQPPCLRHIFPFLIVRIVFYALSSATICDKIIFIVCCWHFIARM